MTVTGRDRSKQDTSWPLDCWCWRDDFVPKYVTVRYTLARLNTYIINFFHFFKNGKWLPDIIERLKASAWHQLYLPLFPFTHARSESINASDSRSRLFLLWIKNHDKRVIKTVEEAQRNNNILQQRKRKHTTKERIQKKDYKYVSH